MNTKIIVALVLGIALIGLTGAASAYIHTETDITGTHFSSVSQTRVSGMPVEYSYESLLVAEFVYPTYPPVDLSWSASELEGTDYSLSTATRSTPTGSIDEYEITNPSTLEGHTAIFNCALWGEGYPQQVILFPTESNEPFQVEWSSLHDEGGAYPAHLTGSHSIFWP